MRRPCSEECPDFMHCAETSAIQLHKQNPPSERGTDASPDDGSIRAQMRSSHLRCDHLILKDSMLIACSIVHVDKSHRPPAISGLSKFEHSRGPKDNAPSKYGRARIGQSKHHAVRKHVSLTPVRWPRDHRRHLFIDRVHNYSRQR
jgi:hypothetical protein